MSRSSQEQRDDQRSSDSAADGVPGTSGGSADPGGMPGAGVGPAVPSRGQVSQRAVNTTLAVVLAVASLLLYVPSLFNGFVDYDDPLYVTANRVVQQGITASGVKWAFTTTTFGNWLPVTWLSHMLDAELFGLKAGGHHFTSAAIHAANAALLFLALNMMTGTRWRAFAVAAVFAVHPLRVESVTWVAERKDVLCATFFLLALMAYTAYARRPSLAGYGMVLALHALGLMSKTMLVTLPFLLLLLDFWPLRRLAAAQGAGGEGGAAAGEPRRVGWLLLEKVPLLALSAVSCVWTWALQSDVGAMWGGRDFTLWQRAGNAVVSIPRYLALTALPVNLSIFYPHPGNWPAWQVALSAALVLAISVAAVALVRRRAYFAVGWFWFLGMLVPVAGLVQVGLASMADRYTYLPGIGLAVVAVWATADLLARRPQWVRFFAVGGAVAMLCLAVGTWRQQLHWRSTVDLFVRALEVDEENWLAHSMVAMACDAAGQDKPAIAHYQRSIELNPHHPDAYHNYGRKLHRLGRVDEAVGLYRRALEIQPDHPMTHFNLGIALASRRQFDEAVSEFELASRYDPMNAHVQVAWGAALLSMNRQADAAGRFNEALRLDPYNQMAEAGLERAMTAPGAAPVAITQ